MELLVEVGEVEGGAFGAVVVVPVNDEEGGGGKRGESNSQSANASKCHQMLRMVRHARARSRILIFRRFVHGSILQPCGVDSAVVFLLTCPGAKPSSPG